MATKKTKQDTPADAGQTIQEQTPESAPAVPEDQGGEPSASTPETPSDAPALVAGDGECPAGREAELHTLDDLALSFRVPTWQQAALVRFMGWAPDKKVSEAEYADALDSLNSRRMGSGRKE